MDQFTIKKKGSHRSCCVPGCGNSQNKNPELTFYAFPNREWETERKKKWIISVRRMNSDGSQWMPTKDTRICSNHFVGGQKSGNPSSEAYNPTIFPWKKFNPLAAERANILKNRTEQVELNRCTVNANPGTCNNFEVAEVAHADKSAAKICVNREIQTEIIFDNEEGLPVIFCWQDSAKNEASTQTTIPRSLNFGSSKVIVVSPAVSVDKKKEKVSEDEVTKVGFRWSEDVQDSKTMKQLGGITLEFFDTLANFVQPKEEGQPAKYIAIKAKDRLLLFLMRMKLGLGFSALSCIFKVNRQTAANVYYSVLETVFIKTKSWIFWPSKEAVEETLPDTFKNYPNCRAIIDCTELRCETPNTVEQRVMMYSTYKSGFTVKYLLGITPCGFISFLSNGYGGRSSDCFIVNHSGFLSLIESGDQIMADKGFPQIKNELSKRNSVLVIPPFATNPQFTSAEVFENYSIASVRIHVERAIQRVKIFKVLEHIKITMLPHIDKIMRVACVLANNKEPLIRPR